MTPDKAEAVIGAAMPRWEAESVALVLAAGCVLREDVRAERDQPPFDRVAMDGIAICSKALGAGVRQFRTRGHRVWFAANGAIRITEAADGKVVLDKPGKDGRFIPA